MFSSIILSLALYIALAQVEVAPTDRPTFQAELQNISATSIEVTEETGRVEIPIEKLRWVRFDPSSPEATPPGPPLVTLTDSSSFACTSIILESAIRQSATAHISLSSDTEIEIPSQNLQRIQLQPLNDAQQAQWQAISQSRTSADTLVLIRSEEALEKLEGIVHSISAETIDFEFGGQRIDAPKAKLAGIHFFAAEIALRPQAKLAAIVRDRKGNRWMSARVFSEEGSEMAQLTLQCGAVISLPLADLREIDFSSGSMQFLADLQPIRTESRKRLELGSSIAGVEMLFGPRKSDSQKFGISSLGPTLEFLGGGASIYRVPDGFARLVGAVELTPSGDRFTPCKVSVSLENEVLWQKRLVETGKRWNIDLPIQADKRLRLDVVAESETPVGDVVLWHEIRFVK